MGTVKVEFNTEAKDTRTAGDGYDGISAEFSIMTEDAEEITVDVQLRQEGFEPVALYYKAVKKAPYPSKETTLLKEDEIELTDCMSGE